MDVPVPTVGVSAFMVTHLPEFFDRFGISFTIDVTQLEYYIYEKKSGQDVSCSMTVDFDETAGQITVMTFYPGLCLLSEVRYLSAVCFFLVMQHAANFYRIRTECSIRINTRRGIFDAFYAQLKDFDFQVLKGGEEDRIDILSRFLPLAMDTSMIAQRLLVEE